MRVYWNTYVSANSRLESVSSGLRTPKAIFGCWCRQWREEAEALNCRVRPG
jgi:hypothetical protein